MSRSVWLLIRSFVLAAAVLVLCPKISRAEAYYITVYNVTFSGPCVGGGTCTEVASGTGFYDPVLNEAWDVSVQLTGSLNVSFVFGTPLHCSAPGCLPTPVLYDPNSLPSFPNTIELDFSFPNFNAPTPTSLSDSELFVPFNCGGDQPNCNQTGAFLGGNDFHATSGTYTSVDAGPDPVPEPGSVTLVATAAGMLGVLSRRRRM